MVSALITLASAGKQDCHHWWLAQGGQPQRLAALMAAPLRTTGQPAAQPQELIEVFRPLPRGESTGRGPGGEEALYRYRIDPRRGGLQLSCWRRYPKGIGWQRRCGPMPLRLFIQRFNATPPHASS